MLNWIKFISAFLLTLVFVIVITVFWNAYQPTGNEKALAKDRVLETEQLEKVYDVQPYNGETSMVTVFGKDQKGENIAIFVDLQQKDKKYKKVKLNDGVSAKEAMQIVTEDQKVEKVMHILLGLEDNEPIWEVAFKNERGKLNYVYIRFTDGEWSKKILNL